MNRRWKSRALWALAAGALGAREARAEGTVTATLAGGVLSVTGDAADNSVLVGVSGNTVLVQGATNTVVSGGTTFDVSDVDSVVIRMGDGRDRVDIFGVPLSGDASIDLGPGDGTLVAVSVTVGGAMDVRGTLGHVQCALTGATVEGDVSIRATKGTAEVQVAGSLLSGNFACDLSKCSGTANTLAVAFSSIVGRAEIRAGKDGGQHEFTGSVVAGETEFVGSPGADTFRSQASRHDGPTTIRLLAGNDTAEIAGTTITDTLLIDGGSGDDTIQVAAPPPGGGGNTLRDVNVKGGGGHDQIDLGSIAAPITISGNVSLKGMGGNDRISVVNASMAALRIDAGGGGDSVTLQSATGSSVRADGKGGQDTLGGLDSGGNNFGETSVRRFETRIDDT
ncbi:MAG: hypothetical protein HMLKMBBP_01632 [Planctomycetes bacterium]|nr:hypothetical protein [Planctomycetota bacterium]